MLSSDCRKASALVFEQLTSAGAPHAALLFAHDQMGSALQQQYATVLSARARQLRRMPAGDAPGQDQTEASSDRNLQAKFCYPKLPLLDMPNIIFSAPTNVTPVRCMQAVGAVQQAVEALDVWSLDSSATTAELEVCYSMMT